MYNGHDIFKLVDTYGLPLDIINLELRDRGEAFNVAEFIQSALKAGWNKNRILWMMKSQNSECNSLIEKVVDHYGGISRKETSSS